jgi:hypothetical protein
MFDARLCLPCLHTLERHTLKVDTIFFLINFTMLHRCIGELSFCSVLSCSALNLSVLRLSFRHEWLRVEFYAANGVYCGE